LEKVTNEHPELGCIRFNYATKANSSRVVGTVCKLPAILQFLYVALVEHMLDTAEDP
jgi:hypothetical protein